ncbi:nucleotidyltransferase domain-containing protein [uncultured Desulfobacter sp.]|uniref:nucleotidyltransferase family protein n=1 Tax=uncultured Desulfobacter sp. TaxID=240139 RepID=UPI002AABCB79|nr:nucleotidyltransferase domain-containing protein [uncultured Desulfobacter sp.]
MRKKDLTRDEVINVLKERKIIFEKKFGISAIGVFGSFAKGKSGPGSDVDIVVKMVKPDLFYMVHIKEELENNYQTKVDIVHYRDKMNPFLKKRIDSEAVYV